MTYVDIAGVHTYYEVTGDGPPIVLLHGGIVGSDSWYAQRDALAAGFTVHTPARRGHGHTPDVAGEISYRLMADDMIGFLETVVRGRAHLVGWSDGAVVGALVALHSPELARRLVLIGQYYNPEGRPEGGLTAQIVAWRDNPPAFLRDMYDRVSPDGPAHFPVFYNKMADLFELEPNISLAELAGIRRNSGADAGAAGRPRRGAARPQHRRGCGDSGRPAGRTARDAFPAAGKPGIGEFAAHRISAGPTVNRIEFRVEPADQDYG